MNRKKILVLIGRSGGLAVGRSVGLLVPSITFEGVELLTSNLVHRWVSVRERFGLFLSEFSSGERGEMGG